jgi:outer membrane protein assembly factor BamB
MSPRLPVLWLVALTAVVLTLTPREAARGQVISETDIARHGLTRPWFAQVEMDPGRSRLGEVVLRDGVIYALTQAAVLNAIDAETGKTLWTRQVGDPKYPSMPPDAAHGRVAVVNGSRLYLLDSANGELLDEIAMTDAPGGGPAISSQRVYVPMVNGMVVAYPILPLPDAKAPKDIKPNKEKKPLEAVLPKNRLVDERREPPLHCRSYGRALIQPLVTRDDPGGEYVVWPTDRGYLYFGRIDRENVNSFITKYRLQTGAPIVSRPAYLPPDPKTPGDAGVVYVTSLDGFVYAIDEEDGGTLWRFPTGEPISATPAIADMRVYVAVQTGGMYCLEAKTGKNLWFAPNIAQFVAAGRQRVYALDRLGRLVALDLKTGRRLDVIANETDAALLSNTDTDRIYVIGRQGLIQCLREAELVAPLVHDKERKDAAKTVRQPPAEEKPEKPAEEHKPAKKQKTPPAS